MMDSMNDLCVIMNFVHYNDLRGARLGFQTASLEICL